VEINEYSDWLSTNKVKLNLNEHNADIYEISYIYDTLFDSENYYDTPQLRIIQWNAHFDSPPKQRPTDLDLSNVLTQMTTYVANGYELSNMDWWANYNDLVITNIDLKEQIALGKLHQNTAIYTAGDKFIEGTKDVFDAVGDFVSGLMPWNWGEEKVEEKDYKNENVYYNANAEEAPVGYYYVNPVTSDYTLSGGLKKNKVMLTSDEVLTAAYLLNPQNSNDKALSSTSDLFMIDRYFYNYFANNYSKGINYDQTISSSSDSSNINRFFEYVSANKVNWMQTEGSPYSLRIESFISLNDEVSLTKKIDFNSKNSKLSNLITINGGNENSVDDVNNENLDTTNTIGQGQIVIRTLGLVYEDTILLDKVQVKQIRIAFIVAVVVVAVVIVTAIFTAGQSIHAAWGAIGSAGAGMTGLAVTWAKFKAIMSFMGTIFSSISSIAKSAIISTLVNGMLASLVIESMTAKFLSRNLTAGSPVRNMAIELFVSNIKDLSNFYSGS
jgi:hypothetical protein